MSQKKLQNKERKIYRIDKFYMKNLPGPRKLLRKRLKCAGVNIYPLPRNFNIEKFSNLFCIHFDLKRRKLKMISFELKMTKKSESILEVIFEKITSDRLEKKMAGGKSQFWVHNDFFWPNR